MRSPETRIDFKALIGGEEARPSASVIPGRETVIIGKDALSRYLGVERKLDTNRDALSRYLNRGITKRE